MDALCRTAAADLAAALEGDDLGEILGEVDRLELWLRELMGDAESTCDDAERLEAMQGAAESVRLAIARLHKSVRTELRRMRAAGPLLRHLAEPPVEPTIM